MEKELITEEMVKEFMADLHPHIWDAWLSFRKSYQLHKQKWCVDEDGEKAWIPRLFNENEFNDATTSLFDTKEEAGDYAKQHQPYLSLAMIREALTETYGNDDSAHIINGLQEGLSKLKNKK